MARPSNRMVDVELVEDGQGEPDAESSRRARTLTPARRRTLAAAAVVVVGAVSAWSLRTDTVAGSRDDAVLSAYADVPGIASSLREPLTSRWQLAAPESVVGGLVIGQEDADGGRRTVAGVLDGETGSPLGTWVASEGSRVPVQVVTSSIGFAVWTAPQEGIWFDRTGAAGARLPGAPVVATVDDGSTPRVILLQDARILRAVDVYEGVLWERPRVQHASIRLDGRVVLEDDGVLRATDVVSGEDLWSVQPGIASVAGTPVLTDGVRFLVAGHPASAEQVVTAYNLRDGSQEWTTSLAGQRLEVPVGSGLPERPGDEVAVFD